MHLSSYFRGYYLWLDHRAHELNQHVTNERLHCFVHEAALVLACEHEILRPRLLDLLFGDVEDALRGRLCDNTQRVTVEAKLSRLAKASSPAAFQQDLALVRDAVALAGLRAESWALFAEAVLGEEDVLHLGEIIGRCHDHCTAPSWSSEPVVRVDVLH